jgi:hypothetical protein
MDPIQLRQAVREVRDLRKNILEKQLFKGYSGRARALGGCIALAAAMIVTILPVKAGYSGLFMMWGGVFLCAVLVNYGALGFWLLRDGNYRKTDMTVVYEVLPVWIVGGILTLALWRSFQFDLLYGSWMGLFGVAQTVTRRRLPRRIVWVGMWYILCGTVCLALPGGLFMKPMVMGLVFFIGELFAGTIMHNSGQGSSIIQLINGGGMSDE